MTAEDTTTLTSARLDLWLWSVRIFKTRSLAADECKGGHVRVNDAPAKPSQKLKKGDVVRVRNGKTYVSLQRALLRQLYGRKIPAENITCADLCTYSNGELFYSHRRDNGNTGAMGSFIAIT